MEIDAAVVSFPGLKKLPVQNLTMGSDQVVLYFAPDTSEVLDGKHPEAAEYDAAGVSIARVLKSQLLGAGRGSFFVDCDSGGSWDPGCAFSLEEGGNPAKTVRIDGLRFILPGNGSIYVDGHNNNMFNVRKKFVWRNGAFAEIKQPYNFVGLESATTRDVEIFSAQDYKQAVAALPKGSPVSVLINEGENYLLKTPFGLVGWIKIPASTLAEEPPIVGIYFAGD